MQTANSLIATAILVRIAETCTSDSKQGAKR
jgi:hypothetical protein